MSCPECIADLPKHTMIALFDTYVQAEADDPSSTTLILDISSGMDLLVAYEEVS